MAENKKHIQDDFLPKPRISHILHLIWSKYCLINQKKKVEDHITVPGFLWGLCITPGSLIWGMGISIVFTSTFDVYATTNFQHFYTA